MRLSVIFTTLLLLGSSQALAAYDGSWFKTDFWSGEYPAGFSVTQKYTILSARSGMNKDLPRNVKCEMPYTAVIHPWNFKRAKISHIQFLSASKIVKLIVKEDFTFNGGDGFKIDLKKGDVLEYLHNDSEGSFQVRVQGKEYTGDQDLFTHVDDVSSDLFQEDDWVRIRCENGRIAYIYLRDLTVAGPQDTDSFVPGINGIGPGMLGYGKVRDLTVREARDLEAGRGK